MNAKLANIYTLLMETYGDKYTISYNLPTYLRQIIGADEAEKAIFVRLEDRKAKTSKFCSPIQLNIKNRSLKAEDLDLTGSPLKDDCANEISQISAELDKVDTNTLWNPEEEYQKGLATEIASKIICNEKFQMQTNAGGTVWILCDAADCSKTIFMQYDFANGNDFSRGIISFAGFVPASSLTSVQAMLEKHGGTGTAQKVDTFIENVYKIETDMLVRCAWSTSVARPALINLSSCEVVLSHLFRVSDCSVLTQDFINQLRMLTCIRNDIIAYKEKENNTKEPVYQCGCGIELEDLRESINNIITEAGGYGKLENDNGIECNIETMVHLVKMRRLSDLTDSLWDVLKRCASYKDLKAAIHMIFQSASRCGVVNVPSNKNRLAEIITQVSNHRLAIPCLTGTEPLELLLEIGLEKLYKDYEYIFTESKICSANSLKNTNDEEQNENPNTPANYRKSLHSAMKSAAAAIPRKTLLHNLAGKSADGMNKEKLAEDMNFFRNSYFDEHDSGLKLAKLLQIHCTLEHLLALQVSLKIESGFSDICEQLLQRPLKAFENIDDNFVDQVEISMPHNSLCEHLNGKDPYSRRIVLKSGNKFRQLKTTFFYCLENICPPSVSANFDNEEESKIGMENIYYSWIYQQIQTAH